MRIRINRLLTSHGRGGLEGDRPSSSLEHQIRAEVQHIASAPTAHRRSRKFPPRYRLHPTEEVWRAIGPPAPASIKPSQKFSISPPLRPRTAEAGNFHPGTVFTHPKRSGVPPFPQLPRPTFPAQTFSLCFLIVSRKAEFCKSDLKDLNQKCRFAKAWPLPDFR